MKTYKGFITKLPDKGIFVFGSNTEGHHAGGAALMAVERFGAIHGEPSGIQGQSYAIPTVKAHIEKLSIGAIQAHVQEFLDFARANPDMEFYLTPIGTGIAGFNIDEMAMLFREGTTLDNLIFPEEFVTYLE